MSKVSILATGSEILDGRVTDTNSNFVARSLNQVGLNLFSSVCCGDQEEEIISALTFLSSSADIVLIFGGLGPTSDDLTREAVARFAGTELIYSADEEEKIKSLFARRGRAYDPINRKQALFPLGATPIPNPVGTAAGFKLTITQSSRTFTLYSLPGVPAEMYAMFEASVLPEISSKILIPVKKKVFRCVTVPESILAGAIEKLKLPSCIRVSYRAAMPEVQVILYSSDQYTLEKYEGAVREAIGKDNIFAERIDGTYENHLQHLLLESKLRVSTAESCTGGMIGTLLTNTAGSSEVFLGAAITYTNESKISLLGVSRETIKVYGAVSTQTAKEMAEGSLRLYDADVAISATGISGPDGGSAEKPVGTFCLGLAHRGDETKSYALFYNANRDWNRKYVAYSALELLRKHIVSASSGRL